MIIIGGGRRRRERRRIIETVAVVNMVGNNRRRREAGARQAAQPRQVAALQNIPVNRPDVVTFPIDVSTNQFTTLNFNPTILQNHATFSEIQTVLTNLDEKLLMNSNKLSKILGLLVFVSFIVFIVSIFFWIFGVDEDTWIIVFWASLVTTILLFLITAIQAGSFKKKEEMRVNQEVHRYIALVNQDYSNRKMLWKMGQCNAWVQLDLLFITEKLPNPQFTINPHNQQNHGTGFGFMGGGVQQVQQPYNPYQQSQKPQQQQVPFATPVPIVIQQTYVIPVQPEPQKQTA